MRNRLLNINYHQKRIWHIMFTLLWPFSKSRFNLMSDRVNLIAPASPVECLLYLPNVRAIQSNWDRKGWPGSEIKMYYGCPCVVCTKFIQSFSAAIYFFHNYKPLNRRRDNSTLRYSGRRLYQYKEDDFRIKFSYKLSC